MDNNDMDKLLSAIYLHALLGKSVTEIRASIKIIVGEELASNVEKQLEQLQGK
ncbi:MAG: hypothetical protein LBM93_00475 [Oscillospiraceae bacterium]|jgi:hypothetical protein|nr:hypothetical protein [Oscillospiraceae bacterium]